VLRVKAMASRASPSPSQRRRGAKGGGAADTTQLDLFGDVDRSSSLAPSPAAVDAAAVVEPATTTDAASPVAARGFVDGTAAAGGLVDGAAGGFVDGTAAAGSVVDRTAGGLVDGAAGTFVDGIAADVEALANAMHARVLHWSTSLGGDTAAARAAAAAASVLVAAQHEGHVCIRVDNTARRALLASKVVAQADRTGALDADLPFVLDAAGRLYLQRVFDDERGIARRLVAAERFAAARPAASGAQARPHTAPIPVDATDRQAQAVALALVAPVLVISGGPGTGKTTTLARAIDLVSRQSPDTRIALAAPTGKAAARVTQALAAARAADPSLAVAMPRARTVHAWLGVHPRTGRARHNARHPLAVDLFVVDEASMLDLELARALFDALPAHARLVLLGDKDQLAAVQAGAVFAELASGATAAESVAAADLRDAPDEHGARDSRDAHGAHGASAAHDAAAQHRVPEVVHLVQGYRFAAGSAIARLSHSVRDGDADAAIALLREASRGGDIAWREPGAATTAAELAASLRPYLAALDNLHARGADDDEAIAACLAALDAWRPLCAVHGGPSGTRAWNLRASALVHARAGAQARPPRAASSDPWFTGRAVMVTRNDATLGLVNGDVGITLPPLPPRSLRPLPPEGAGPPWERPGGGPPAQARRNENDDHTLRHAAFLRADGRIARWPVARLPAVETAFATSVHKAQGSEFDRVTLVLPTPWQRPCTRELIYTAITRARRHVTVIADEASLRASIATRTERLGGLGERLREAHEWHALESS
jgi:exodeoxyribonuclease V alpha subunit